MSDDIQRWFKKEGERLLVKVGIQPGYHVLDFGCGKGAYAIPAAKVVGKTGGVYALDKNRYALAELVREASSRGLTNVVPIHSIDELKSTLGENRLNAVLLYDVIHGYYFTPEQRKNVLGSVAAKVMSDGIMSIFPRHMSSQEIDGTKNQLRILGFMLETRMEGKLLHDGHFASGCIYNFRKRITPHNPDISQPALDE